MTYCPIRRDLERRNWGLTSRYGVLTGHLLDLIGKEHEQFLAMLDRCNMAARDANESRDELQAHRREHRC